MLSLGGRLWEVVCYESIDHNGSNFFLIRIWSLPRLNPCANADAMFYSCESQFREKNRILPVESVSCNSQEYDNVTTFLYRSSGRLRRLKSKESFKLLALRVVAVAHERWSLTRGYKYGDLTWKVLIFWKTGRWGVAAGGWTVYMLIIACSRLSVSRDDRKSGREIPLVPHPLFRSSPLTESLEQFSFYQIPLVPHPLTESLEQASWSLLVILWLTSAWLTSNVINHGFALSAEYDRYTDTNVWLRKNIATEFDLSLIFLIQLELTFHKAYHSSNKRE